MLFVLPSGDRSPAGDVFMVILVPVLDGEEVAEDGIGEVEQPDEPSSGDADEFCDGFLFFGYKLTGSGDFCPSLTHMIYKNRYRE